MDCTEQDSVCLVVAALSHVPWVNAFNEGKYLKCVTCFRSVQSLLYFWGFSFFFFFFFRPILRLQMMQFELGLSKSSSQSPYRDARGVCCISEKTI